MIGLDFDNTIICYDKVFFNLAKSMHFIQEDSSIVREASRNASFGGNKTELRNLILALPEGMEKWQRMQGRVYGQLISQASLFPGVKAFLESCKKNGLPLCIVSHKTQFGHFDESNTNLREAALGWIRQHGLTEYISENQIYFEETREQKIQRIISLNCHYFIDDLIEVFKEPFFPATTKKILFNTSNFNLSLDNLQTYGSWNAIRENLCP